MPSVQRYLSGRHNLARTAALVASSVRASTAIDRVSAVRAGGGRVRVDGAYTGHEATLDASPKFWAFVFVETEPPFGVACYVLDAASLRVGMRHCARAYRLFAECQRTGHWPAYPDTIEPISLPAWAKKFQGE